MGDTLVKSQLQSFMMIHDVIWCLFFFSKIDLGTKLFGFTHDNLQPK